MTVDLGLLCVCGLSVVVDVARVMLVIDGVIWRVAGQMIHKELRGVANLVMVWCMV